MRHEKERGRTSISQVEDEAADSYPQSHVLSGFYLQQNKSREKAPFSLVFFPTIFHCQLGDKNEAKNRHGASTKNKTEAAEKALFFSSKSSNFVSPGPSRNQVSQKPTPKPPPIYSAHYSSKRGQKRPLQAGQIPKKQFQIWHFQNNSGFKGRGKGMKPSI